MHVEDDNDNVVSEVNGIRAYSFVDPNQAPFAEASERKTNPEP